MVLNPFGGPWLGGTLRAPMSASAALSNRGKSQPDDTSLAGSWLRVLLVWAALALVVCAILFVPSMLRAYALLVRFADPSASGPLVRFETHAVRVEEVSIPTAEGPLRARMYTPVGVNTRRAWWRCTESIIWEWTSRAW
jgi:hypothetical protein